MIMIGKRSQGVEEAGEGIHLAQTLLGQRDVDMLPEPGNLFYLSFIHFSQYLQV